MWLTNRLLAVLAVWSTLTRAAPYDAEYADYNINMNQNAKSPLEYTTTRPNGKWTPSPENWREIAFYTILPDKFADGNPENNDYFGTMYEADWRETQLRFGGDVKGMQAKLDYLQGMGMRGIFMSGTMFLNMLWQADSE
jgi:alpha-1,3-glucan synthase